MAIAHLPEEILLNHIFCRLPVKSLLCFRSVCKLWNRMLRDQQFVKLHLKNHQLQSCNVTKKLLIRTELSKLSSYYSIDCDEDAAESRVAEPPPEIPEVVVSGIARLLGSCNGLVAIIAMNDIIVPGAKLILWNPSYGESKYLIDTHPTIAFKHLFGFVYDSTTDDYKIIRIIASMSEECDVDIYSLRNNSGKKVKVVPYNLYSSPVYCTQAGVELNGYLYWMVMPPNSRSVSDPSVTGFGLRDESLTFQGLPSDFSCRCYYTGSYMGLKAMGRSCIAALRFYMNNKLVVWTSQDPEIKENKWEKLITLSLSSPQLEFTCSIRPLWFTKDGKVLLILAFNRGNKNDQHQHNFGVYDPHKSSLEFVQIYGIGNTSHLFGTTEMEYIPSLVSPNMFESGIRQVMDTNTHQVIDTKMRQDLGAKKRKGA